MIDSFFKKYFFLLVVLFLFPNCLFSQYRNVDYNLDSIVIGNQVWMQWNLDVKHFRNGDELREVHTGKEWKAACDSGIPAFGFYDNDLAKGVVYNWFAVNDKRGLAPLGWHVPTNDDWILLIDNLGGYDSAGVKLKNRNLFKGNNQSGFNALPNGFCSADGWYIGNGDYGCWWSSTMKNMNNSWFFYLYLSDNKAYFDYNSFGHGYSVRCLKN
jgi:uncharacterized protein (TIGR02145 family)